MDAWHKVAADAVIAELSSRKGFNGWWGPIDEDISDEIMDAIAAAVLQAYEDCQGGGEPTCNVPGFGRMCI